MGRLIMGRFKIEFRTINGHEDIWTQRKDKNGNKIYTNDILLVSPEEREVVVGYEPRYAAFWVYENTNSEPYRMLQHYDDSDLEVIGNIYEGTPSRCPYEKGDYVMYNFHIFKVIKVYGDYVDIESARGHGCRRGLHHRELQATSRVQGLPSRYLPYLVGRKYTLKDGRVGIITEVNDKLVRIGTKYYTVAELSDLIVTIDDKPFLPIVCNDDKSYTRCSEQNVLWLPVDEDV